MILTWDSTLPENLYFTSDYSSAVQQLTDFHVSCYTHHNIMNLSLCITEALYFWILLLLAP